MLVVDEGRDEVVAVKRVSWAASNTTATGNARGGRQGMGKDHGPNSRAVVKLEPKNAVRKLEVVVMSDTYIGMKWRIGGVEVPGVPVVADDGGKNGA